MSLRYINGIVNENFIDFIMDNIISNANAYAAFLDGEATKDEMYVILKKMMRDSQLIMALNLAAVVNSKNNEKPYNAKRQEGFVLTSERDHRNENNCC